MVMDNNEYKSIFNKDTPKVSLKKVWVIIGVLCLLFGYAIFYQAQKINRLSAQVNNTKKVYIYDLQEALRGLKIDVLNAEFEARVNILNQEVLSAQDKISSLKDSNVRENFSDVYLNSLKMKRDNMIKDYNDTLQDITTQINENLVNMAEEKQTPTIFNKQSIGAMTPDVEDITQELVEKIKIKRARNLLK